eukprot:gene19883-14471_t
MKREQLPVVDKVTRSRQVAKAYNTAPYVLRPATRSPSRNSRSKKAKSRSPVRRAAESSRSPRPAGEDDDDDASSRIDVERGSGPPTESSIITRLPVIPVDMRDVEKVAVEIIHKVRTHNGKKSHSPEARRKLSPSELVLLKSPFAQPVFPQKRRSPSPQKGPVPPPGKRPSQQQATASLPRSPRRIKPPTMPAVTPTADVDFVVAAVDGDTPE